MIGRANAGHAAEPAQHQAELWGGGKQVGELRIGSHEVSSGMFTRGLRVRP